MLTSRGYRRLQQAETRSGTRITSAIGAVGRITSTIEASGRTRSTIETDRRPAHPLGRARRRCMLQAATPSDKIFEKCPFLLLQS